MFKKKESTEKEPLTPQEEKIKQFKKKHLRLAGYTFLVTWCVTMIGLAAYVTGNLTAGTLIVVEIPFWSLTLLMYIAAASGIQRFTIKTYFEELKYRDL